METFKDLETQITQLEVENEMLESMRWEISDSLSEVWEIIEELKTTRSSALVSDCSSYSE